MKRCKPLTLRSKQKEQSISDRLLLNKQNFYWKILATFFVYFILFIFFFYCGKPKVNDLHDSGDFSNDYLRKLNKYLFDDSEELISYMH